MKREIHEDMGPFKKPIRVYATVVLGLAILAGVTAVVKAGDNFSLGAVGMFAVILPWAYVELLWRRREQVRWFLTDEGLIRISRSGEEENIPWENIDSMTKGRKTLTIEWSKPEPGTNETLDDDDSLYVNEDEA
jgi:hypothetical protein